MRSRLAIVLIGSFVVSSTPAMAQLEERLVRISRGEAICIAENAAKYAQSDSAIFFVFEGSCSRVVTDIRDVDLGMVNQSRIETGGTILVLTKAEIRCLAQRASQLDRRSPRNAQVRLRLDCR